MRDPMQGRGMSGFTAAALLSFALLSGCADRAPTSPDAGIQAFAGDLANSHTAAFTSGSPGITTYDPILPASADPFWETTVCRMTPDVGLDASWQKPHSPFVLSGHPWAGAGGSTFLAPWINARNSLGSVGPGGHNWTKYTMSVSGTGQHVVQLLADNCSWIYLDNSLAGVQGVTHAAVGGKYPVTLNGTHVLSFIIFDGGGLAGGKFRLETRQSYIDHGGDPSTLPPPIQLDDTPPSVVANVTGTLGSNGWYTSNVSVTWSVVDGESSVTSTSGCGPSSLTSDTPGAGFTCTATSAGGTASGSVTVKRDATNPDVGFSGNAGTYTVDQTVAISCAASDAMSGLASSTCPGASGDAYSFGVGSHTLSASAEDKAGNTASASTQFTVQVTSGSLCVLVRRWVNQHGIANSMCKQLANGAYGAFRNHVNAQSGKSVTAANAAVLIALSNSL